MAVKVVQLMMKNLKPFVKAFKVGAISSRLPLPSVDLIELQLHMLQNHTPIHHIIFVLFYFACSHCYSLNYFLSLMEFLLLKKFLRKWIPIS